MPDSTRKLQYKILQRRPMDGDMLHLGLECVNVEWTRVDGGEVEDFEIVPVTHPPKIKYERRSCGHRKVIVDQVNVPAGCPDSMVMQILEEKRERLQRDLGL